MTDTRHELYRLSHISPFVTDLPRIIVIDPELMDDNDPAIPDEMSLPEGEELFL